MKLLTSVLFLLIAYSVQAQRSQKISLSGIVKSKVPIHSADCFLKNNEHLGNATDSLGYFHFGVPKALLYDTLVILAMGFERKEVPLAFFNQRQDTVHVYLEQQSIVLNEVLIEAKGLDLKAMVLKAVASIPNNYPNRRHQMTGLYRKVSTKSGQYTHLEEAAFTIEDNGYKKPVELVRIKTEHFRQTKDWGDIDSFYVAVSDKMSRRLSLELNTSRNPQNRAYEGSSPIRHYHTDNSYFNFRSMRKLIDDYYTFELMNIAVENGDTIYQIAFSESHIPPPPKRASGRTYLRINTSDFAIVEGQFTKGDVGNYALLSQEQIRFEKVAGRYYPKYIRQITPRYINRNFKDEEFDIHTFWFDDLRLRDFRRLKVAEVNDRQDPHSYRRQTSSSLFWDTTALINKYPLEPAVKTDLESRQTLEEQFKGNGKH